MQDARWGYLAKRYLCCVKKNNLEKMRKVLLMFLWLSITTRSSGSEKGESAYSVSRYRTTDGTRIFRVRRRRFCQRTRKIGTSETAVFEITWRNPYRRVNRIATNGCARIAVNSWSAVYKAIINMKRNSNNHHKSILTTLVANNCYRFFIAEVQENTPKRMSSRSLGLPRRNDDLWTNLT